VPICLGLHLRDSLHASDFVPPARVSAPLLRSNLVRPCPPEWEVVSRNHASLEVSRPSGGFSPGVRSTRGFHPRHLPPLGFLNPSTACSSSQLARLLSYEHHLWGSKFKEHKRQLRAEARSRVPRRFIDRQSSFGTHQHWTRRQPKPSATEISKVHRLACLPS